MKFSDWYVGAVFVIMLWGVAVVSIYVMLPVMGLPLSIVGHVIEVVSTWMFMLAATFAGVGATQALVKVRA